MLTVPATIADLEPTSATLPPDLAVCSLPDGVDVDMVARRLCGHPDPNGAPARKTSRPTNSIKFKAKTLQLYITLWRRAEVVPTGFVTEALMVALGQEAAARQRKARVITAYVLANRTEPTVGAELARVPGVGVRRAYDLAAEPEITALTEQLRSGADILDVLSPAEKIRVRPGTEVHLPDADRLSGQIIASVRSHGHASDEDLAAAFALLTTPRVAVVPPDSLGPDRHRVLVTEAMVMALAVTLGLVDAQTGQPTRQALSALWQTIDPKGFKERAEADAEAIAMTGKHKSVLDESGLPVRVATTHRSRPAYRRLVASKRTAISR